jgi:hypothetical protein
VQKDLWSLIKALSLNKRVNPNKADRILKLSFDKLDTITEDISKHNLKIDYRSDKTRYMILGLIGDLKRYFDKAREVGFNMEKLNEYDDIKNLNKITEDREALKKKMKDIESDYL